jgi:hypothetical protein
MSNQLGKNASIIAWLPCLWQEVKTTLSGTTLGVVEIAPHVSPSNKLGINRSNGSNLLGKMRSSSQTTIKGHGQKSIYIKHERGCGLCQNSWREVDLYKGWTWPWPPSLRLNQRIRQRVTLVLNLPYFSNIWAIWIHSHVIWVDQCSSLLHVSDE